MRPSLKKLSERKMRVWPEKYILPGVYEARMVGRTPTEIRDAWDVRRLLVEPPHVFNCQELEGLAVASSVGQKVEQ